MFWIKENNLLKAQLSKAKHSETNALNQVYHVTDNMEQVENRLKKMIQEQEKEISKWKTDKDSEDALHKNEINKLITLTNRLELTEAWEFNIEIIVCDVKELLWKSFWEIDSGTSVFIGAGRVGYSYVSELHDRNLK